MDASPPTVADTLRGIIHSRRTICHRSMVLDQLALLLFQVAEAHLGDRKDLGSTVTIEGKSYRMKDQIEEP